MRRCSAFGDWSLNTGNGGGEGGGGVQNGKIAGPILFAPRHSRQDYSFFVTPFKGVETFYAPYFSMAKTILLH